MSRSPVSVLKRRREQALRERQQLKAEKRAQRKNMKAEEPQEQEPALQTPEASE